MKKIKLLINSIIFALFLYSCGNVLQESNKTNVIQNRQYNCSVSGQITVDGALPDDVAEVLNASYQNTDDRTAFPSKPVLNSCQIEVTAVNNANTSETYNNVDFGTGNQSYKITNLPHGNFTVYVNVTSADILILSGQSEDFTLSQENSICPDINVVLKPVVSTSGTGNIELKAKNSYDLAIRCDSLIQKAPSSYNGQTTFESGLLSNGDESVILSVNDLPSGTYDIDFVFKNTNGGTLYIAKQTVNVFDGLTTNRWVNNGEDKCFKENNNIISMEITSELISNYNQIKDFFVDCEVGSPDNPGTWPFPVKTIGQAISKMTDSNADYTINIVKSINGTVNLSAGSINARSITIRGENDVCLNGNGTNQVLYIQTPQNVTITIENLTIKNGSDTTGAGIYVNGTSKVIIGKGTRIENNTATSKGGGIFISASSTVSFNDEAVVCKNSAPEGGGIYISSGCSCIMNAGTIGGVNLENSATNGGAVYNAGSFTIGGTASIPYGGSGSSNDVYLVSGKTVGISNLSEGSTAVATITPQYFKRGTDILSSSAGALNSNIVNRFNLSQDNDGWNRVIATDYKSAKIDSPIYVVDSTDSGNTRPSGFAKGKPSGANGLKTNPYASIAAALGCSELSLEGNTITIAGTVSSQAINSSTSISGSATNVTIEGYKPGNSASTAKIDAKNTANTTALSINKSGLTVTIKNLTITGGNATNGGGINITKGIVVLTDGAVITGNQATNNGGGVYIASVDAKLLMNGKALIGDSASSKTTAESTSTSTYANKAKNGGGIYNGGYLYLGYSLDSNGSPTTTNSALISNATNGYYGVRRNYASEKGGGIYNAYNYCYMDSGNVSYNQAANGGGFYFTATSTLNAGSIDGNKAQNGGGIYIPSSTKVTLKSVSMTSNSAIGTSSAAAIGGAVYNIGTLEFSDVTSAASMTSNSATSTSQNTFGGAIYSSGTVNIYGAVSINSNNATTTGSGKTGRGGAIYNDNGSVTMKKGSIGTTTMNTASSYGGAVYQNGNFTIEGDACLYNSSNSNKNNDVYLPSGKTIKVDGTLSSNNVASIMPAVLNGSDPVARGKIVIEKGSNLSAMNASILAKFNIPVTNTEWYITLHSSQGKLDAPIWVAGGGTYSSGVASYRGPSNTNNGTKNQPFADIATAVQACWASDLTFTINVDGTLSGPQTMPAASGTTGLALSIAIEGTSTSTTINAGGTGSTPTVVGSALTINNTALVTITNLKIQGGYSSDTGGGIRMATSTKVNLGSNVVIRENIATTFGGGVYLPSGAILCLSSNALIGNSSGTRPANKNVVPGSSNGYNKGSGGGGIYSAGTLGLGKTVNTSGTLSDASYSGGIYCNVATSHGGGIYSSGSLYTNGSFYVSKNFTDSDGGGVYTASTCEISAGTWSSNKANGYGGGVKHTTDNTTLTVSGGSFTSNESGTSGGGISHHAGNLVIGNVTISSNQSGNNEGGAIYSTTDFTLQGSDVSIPFNNGIGKNDIYMNQNKKVILSNITSFSKHATSNPIRIYRPDNNVTVLGGTNVSSLYDRFASSADGYFINSSGVMIQGYLATASNVGDIIGNFSSGTSARIVLTGSFSNFASLKTALSNSSAKISIDMSGVTGVSQIPDNAFEGCTSLYSISLPETITKIGTRAFYNCTNLGTYYNSYTVTSSTQTVYLPIICKEIGREAFVNCHFNTMDLSKVTTIYTSAFQGWTGTGNQTVTFTTVNGGETAKKYTGTDYTTDAGTCNLPMASLYYDYLGYGDAKIVKQ